MEALQPPLESVVMVAPSGMFWKAPPGGAAARVTVSVGPNPAPEKVIGLPAVAAGGLIMKLAKPEIEVPSTVAVKDGMTKSGIGILTVVGLGLTPRTVGKYGPGGVAEGIVKVAVVETVSPTPMPVNFRVAEVKAGSTPTACVVPLPM